LAGAVSVPRVQGGRDDAEDVRGAGKKQGDDVVVAQGCDDGGEEVGNGRRGDDAEDEDELMKVSGLVQGRVKEADIPESSHPRQYPPRVSR
ncbi:pantothenate transporter liz1, partial [Colletotrichum asianum]